MYKTQPIIDKAASIKCKKVKVLNVCVDVESVPFNKGFYSVDMTFYFLVELSVYLSPGTPAVNCCGISYFSKKVILYGSEANARVFSSHTGCCNGNEQLTAMPNIPPFDSAAAVPTAGRLMICRRRLLFRHLCCTDIQYQFMKRDGFCEPKARHGQNFLFLPLCLLTAD